MLVPDVQLLGEAAVDQQFAEVDHMQRPMRSGRRMGAHDGLNVSNVDGTVGSNVLFEPNAGPR